MLRRTDFYLLAGTALCALVVACGVYLLCKKPDDRLFIADDNVRNMVEEAYIKRYGGKHSELPYPVTFHAGKSMSEEEAGAMVFLYTFMPACDVAEHSPDFFLQNVRASFAARRAMRWGRTVPDELFRHFVLPVRVNNEALDSSRSVFYAELKPRVAGLSMRKAALEVNHWCHEKVSYAPSDSRTSAPLATLRSATGRCGEESTFAVAAMRAVGIPARQVYTPRWAHTDDNHAWIEVWIDGQWHYMGACEPEPVLDMGWFDAPAKRAMLVHTKVFGSYAGNDEIISSTPCYTEINVTSRYAPVKRAAVTVLDSVGQAAAGAEIDFCVYNYAEFYPVATRTADLAGIATLTIGLGDALVRARSGTRFGFAILAAEDEHVTVDLSMQEGSEAVFDFTVTPPVEVPVTTHLTETQRKQNDLRKEKGDALRKQYEATFYTETQSNTLADELALDRAEVWKYMRAARGNFSEIARFMRMATPEERPWTLKLLATISEKDLRDAAAATLYEDFHFTLSRTEFPTDTALFVRYVLNPRIANEPLSACRSLFSSIIFDNNTKDPDPNEALHRFSSAFHRDDTYNPQHIPVSIGKTVSTKRGDAYSLTITAVGFLRTLGVPARIAASGHCGEYFYKGQWYSFSMNTNDPSKPHKATPVHSAVGGQQGYLRLTFTADKALKTPRYETHYTLSEYAGGRFPAVGIDAHGTVFGETNLIGKTVAINNGYWLLTTGRRMADGSVTGRMTFFNIAERETVSLPLVVPENNNGLQVIGNIDAEAKYRTATHADGTILQTVGRGYFVLALLDGETEPTVHALHALETVAGELEQWGRPFLMLFANSTQLQAFEAAKYPRLPSAAAFGYDAGGSIQRMLESSLEILSGDKPVFIIADSFGRVVYVSQGYRIGLGEALLDHLPDTPSKGTAADAQQG
ncbi:MAG: transglutaminase-like domain-containing protein [Prevotellaceae bacterium]|jgi:transglutaminase-like putative cysteine protease|nr:transglutaminase-like domain-containing protein [Prevotellaceae bacterium]